MNVVHYQHVPEHHDHAEHQQQQRPVVLVLKVWYVIMSFMNLHKKGFHIPVAGGAPPARPSRKQSRSHSNLLLSRSISPSAPSSGVSGRQLGNYKTNQLVTSPVRSPGVFSEPK